ncbi:MAG: hypothetical protein U0002_05830 [Thermoanaerobaculia bacterium]
MMPSSPLPRMAVRLALAALPGWRLGPRGRSLSYQAELPDADRAVASIYFTLAVCFRRARVARLSLEGERLSLELQDLTLPAVTPRLLLVAEEAAANLALFQRTPGLARPLPPPNQEGGASPLPTLPSAQEAR